MDNAGLRKIAEEVKSWLSQGPGTFSTRKLKLGTKSVILKCWKSEDVAENYQELFPREIAKTKNLDHLSYPDEEPGQSVQEPSFSWEAHWLAVVQRLGFSYAHLTKTGIQLTVCPMRLHPHIFPYLAWIITEKELVTVVDGFLDEDFLPLETVLRYYSSNIDYDSQTVNLLTAQVAELCGQLYGWGLNVPLELHSIYCDDALWLLFDPISSIFKKTRIDLDKCTQLWITGKKSNYDYILDLNTAAGRKRGEVHNHPIFPWICDFSKKDGGWRPLNRTKFRLNKGDDQLKETYNRTPAHHVAELLSDIGYMVYRARIETKENLCKHVRSKWVPLEYPVSVSRMYEWTPDECIPEFYDSPEIFRSVHPDMPDLELPPFIKSPQEFVQWHRKMLESEEVSQNLHKWIDLTFGHLLSGEEAVLSFNVHLSLVEKSANRLRRWGVVQLFDRPHPKKDSSDEPLEERLLRMDFPTHIEFPKEVEEEDEDSLVTIYRRLRQKRVQNFATTMLSSFSLLEQICLAPVTYGRFHKEWLERNFRQHAHLIPLSLRDLIEEYSIKKATLPFPKEFPLFLITEMNVPFPLVSLHDKLSDFYSLHILRRSIPTDNDNNLQK